MNNLNKYIKKFSNISFKGRLAFAMSCMENVIIKFDLYNVNPDAIEIIIKKLWVFSDCEYLDEWHYSLTDIVPEFICEFYEYEKQDLEYLTEQEFYILYKFYTELAGTKVMKVYENVFMIIYELSREHIYSRIDFPGQDSLNRVIELVTAMQKYEIELPDVNLYKKYRFNENRGFGNDFDAKEVAMLLK